MQEMVESIKETQFPVEDKSIYCTVKPENPGDPPTGKVRLFVYGTLKRNYGNNHIISKTGKYLGEGLLYGYMMINCGAFPAICKEEIRSYKVYGEVWEIDEETLARCDRLEGTPTHYQRVPIYIPHYQYCFTYVQPSPKVEYRRIDLGKWEGPESPFTRVIQSKAVDLPGRDVTPSFPPYDPNSHINGETRYKAPETQRATIWGLPQPRILETKKEL